MSGNRKTESLPGENQGIRPGSRIVLFTVILVMFAQTNNVSISAKAVAAGEARAAAPEGESVAGWAVEWTGEWFVEGKGRRKIGVAASETRSIPNCWHLVRTSKTGTIRVALVDGNVFESPRDRLPGQPISVKSNPTFLERIISAAIGLLSSRPSLLVCPIARPDPTLPPQLSKILLKDGIANSQADGIDLSAVFTNADDGEYMIELFEDPARRADGRKRELKSVAVKKGVARLSGALEKGVYSIKLMRDDGRGETGKESWILVAKESDCKRMNEAIVSAVRTVDEWTARKLSSRSSTPYLHAFLYALRDAPSPATTD